MSGTLAVMSTVHRRAKRAYRKFALVAGALICLELYLWSRYQAKSVAEDTSYQTSETTHRVSCRDLPGANDTVVIMKTGSTEISAKLPIHLSNTMQCYPNYLIFSDVAEQFEGETIIDALEDVDPHLKQNHYDFELYRRLQAHGRKSLKPSELSGPVSRSQGGSGKPTNDGWRLDKWKFLPMVRKALEVYPDKRWYVFVETDTYVFWKTLLAYLEVLDWERPYYVGSPFNIGDVIFAQGGSAYAVSRPALEMVVRHYIDHKKDWEDYTADHWAGDCVLGKAFENAGVQITHAWPIIQSGDIGEMDYSRAENGNRLWCYPTISYHHLAPSVIKDLWQFEQLWLTQDGKHPSSVLFHKDVYAHYILPRVTVPKLNWNNHCDQDQGSVSSLDECRELCKNDEKCLQYSVNMDGRCFSTSRPNLGEVSRGTDSGWIYTRMRDFYDSAEPCGNEGWLL